MKEILVCNCGSSSLKADVFGVGENAGALSSIADATAERLGSDDAALRLRVRKTPDDRGQSIVEERVALPGMKHQAALQKINALFETHGVFPPANRQGVGHRVVHGGPFITAPVLLDRENIQIVERCAEFAPLHNPANLIGIRECETLFGVPQVGVFDTAFHATIPPEAYTYALPRALTEQYGLRRYGFHGTSHEYCARILAERFAQRSSSDSGTSRKLKFVTMHLGNGASVCAIDGGRSIDTSMGFTPLEGLVMGTRSGDLDPALIEVLIEKEGLSIDEVGRLLNESSGLKGVCGHSDMRDLLAARSGGDSPESKTEAEAADLALKLFCYRAKKYLGAYTAALGGAIDAIAFTAGIGENAPLVRASILAGLEDGAGIALDPAKNLTPPPDGEIQAEHSRVRVFVIPADEELAIANKTLRLIAD
ncbi:MAG: acetate kinase [Leptospirales bacterium]